MKQSHVLMLVAGVTACSSTPRNDSSLVGSTNTQSEARPSNDDPGFDPNARNPFWQAQIYVNESYAKKLQDAATRHPDEAAKIKLLASQPTAVWLDSIDSAKTVTSTLQSAVAQIRDARPMTTVFVLYDLPNRDCSAKASSGELAGDKNGIQRYQREFIDPIVAAFARFPEQRIVAILEPDSLPNLATNLSIPKCAQSESAYRSSIAYAVSKLDLPNVYTYLDAAHAGWLGWNGNRTRIAHLFQDVLAQAGGPQKIRGFATNVSNYNTLASAEGRRLGPANPCPDELTYIAKLSEELRRVGIVNKQFIIDTSRNGKAVRQSWGHWCNIKGAGLGMRPVAAPSPQVDAYLWVKPPGESDGVADPGQPRFDPSCTSSDSLSGAPEAGQWFEAQFMELMHNANPKI